MQILQTLKRDVAQDVTDAFTLSAPLVNQHPDLYRNSTSFLDFLFKLCDAPPPKMPCLMPNTDRHKDELILYKDNLAQKEQELNKVNDALALKEKEYRELWEVLKKFERPKSDDTLPIEQQQNYIVSPDNTQSAIEWQNEMKTEMLALMSSVKEEVAQQFGLTMENQNKLDELISKLQPQGGSEPLALPYMPIESTVPVNEISDSIYQKLEKLLVEKVSSQQARDLLDLSKLNEQFEKLDKNLSHIKLGQKMMEKVQNLVEKTRSSLTNNFKKLFSNITTLFGKDIISPLVLMQKVDTLERQLLDAQWAKDPCLKMKEYYKTLDPMDSWDNWDQKFIDIVTNNRLKLDHLITQISHFKEYFPSLDENNWFDFLNKSVSKLQHIFTRMKEYMEIPEIDFNMMDKTEFDAYFFNWLTKNVTNLKIQLTNAQSQLHDCPDTLQITYPEENAKISELENWEEKYISLKSTFDNVKSQCLTLFPLFGITDDDNIEQDWSSNILKQTKREREKYTDLKSYTQKELAEKVQLIEELQRNGSALQQKYQLDQFEWETKMRQVTEKYNEKCSEKNIPEGLKKRKMTDDLINEPSTEVSSQYLKALLKCIFEKYFYLLWSFKQTPGEMFSDLKIKLDILNALVIPMRPNDLLLILIQYVQLDLSYSLEGQIVFQNLVEEVKMYKTEKELLDDCVLKTVRMIQEITGAQAMIDPYNCQPVVIEEV